VVLGLAGSNPVAHPDVNAGQESGEKIARLLALLRGYGTTSNFSVQLSHLDAIYFSVGTLTTAGTGNIVATSEIARGIQTIQMILDLILVVFAVTLVLSALSSRLAKRLDGDARSASHKQAVEDTDH
jgi:bacteriorhodopsin